MTDDRGRDPANDDVRPLTAVREAHDGETHSILGDNPSDEDAMADIANDESFPASDPPSHAAPDHGGPAPSSGYDVGAERLIAEGRVQAETDARAHVTGTEVSGGTKLGTMRYVLGISLVVIVIAFAALLMLNR